ncbi:MAG: hypothetical protein Q9203_002111 [Teloschistes exilis]
MDNPKAQSSERRENKGPSFLATALVFTIIALVFVSLRLRVRTWVEHSAGWDDGMIVFSTILAIVSTAFNIPEVQAGYGRHQATLSEIALIESLKWNYLATPLLVLSIAASKISICLMLLRILEKTKAIFRRSLPYGMMVLLTANATSAAGYALGQSINAFADFALALFPLSFIKDLHLQLHRKIILGLLMCCGTM